MVTSLLLSSSSLQAKKKKKLSDANKFVLVALFVAKNRKKKTFETKTKK